MDITLTGGILRVRDLYRIAWEILTENTQHVLVILLLLVVPGSLVDYGLYIGLDVDPNDLSDIGNDLIANFAGWLFILMAIIYFTLLTVYHLREAASLPAETRDQTPGADRDRWANQAPGADRDPWTNQTPGADQTPGGASVPVAQLFADSVRVYIMALAVSVIISVLVIIGLMFCFVPGVIVGVWLAFALQIVILDGAGPFRAIGSSKQLVDGHFWHVLGMTIAVALPWLVLTLVIEGLLAPATGRFVSGVFNGFGSLFATIAWTVFYLNARAVWSGNHHGDAGSGTDENDHPSSPAGGHQ